MDLICIGTKSDPIPLKDVSDDLLDGIQGKYLGHTPLIRTLKEDTFRFTVDKKDEDCIALGNAQCQR